MIRHLSGGPPEGRMVGKSKLVPGRSPAQIRMLCGDCAVIGSPRACKITPEAEEANKAQVAYLTAAWFQVAGLEWQPPWGLPAPAEGWLSWRRREPHWASHPLSTWRVEKERSEGRRKEALKGERKSAFALCQSRLSTLENEAFSQYWRVTEKSVNSR